ncbi:type II toxin-antitoxin system RelE/ParE family toxin [bacterium]|nr:type II toxin-antitoxin system RelE/ParE family toxin [bacterium]MBU1615407.1 type II toxin-antitoxin system RelE/ParE family toxin [bacterium]
MEISKKRTMYKVIFLPDAEESFKNLDKTIQERIAGKIDWLAENADRVIHHPLSSLPNDLRGLCRMRIGDYRLLYWVYTEIRQIKVYEIEHRSKGYRSIKW